MISEALELRMEGGQLSHSWCMCAVSYGYGGFGGDMDGGGGWYACSTKSGGVGDMLGDVKHFLSTR